jgi:hypothetical protein
MAGGCSRCRADAAGMAPWSIPLCAIRASRKAGRDLHVGNTGAPTRCMPRRCCVPRCCVRYVGAARAGSTRKGLLTRVWVRFDHSPDTALRTRALGQALGAQDLFEAAHHLVMEEFLDVAQTNSFLELDETSLSQLISSDDLLVNSEQEVLPLPLRGAACCCCCCSLSCAGANALARLTPACGPHHHAPGRSKRTLARSLARPLSH